ncbi:MAG: DNA polymerase IV [Pleomorphochaeta sp.]
MINKVYFHVDLDAFFAAVEILDNPSLKNKPVIIGGNGKRGVASTCNYIARSYGVHSAMPMQKAKQLCPHAIIIQGNHSRYSQMSKKVMNIFKEFSPIVQQVSIDEAFLDMSGTEKLFGHPYEVGKKLKEKVLNETGLTISVGIGPSKLIAKLASDFNKPDGLCIVDEDRKIEFIDAVGIKKLWGVGKVTQDLIKKKNIKTTKQLRTYSISYLQKAFGSSMGEYLYKVARGEDPGIYSKKTKSHSISTERTFQIDLSNIDILSAYLLDMSHEILYRSIEEKQMAKTIGIKIRYSDFTTISAQITPSEPIYCAEQVFDYAMKLFDRKWKKTPIRLLGVGLYQTYKGEFAIQEDLFSQDNKKKRALEKVALELKKNGQILTKATLIKQVETEKEDYRE